jgi:hypothetical protein
MQIGVSTEISRPVETVLGLLRSDIARESKTAIVADAIASSKTR